MVFNSINNFHNNNSLSTSDIITTPQTHTLRAPESSTNSLLNKMNSDLCSSLGVNMSQQLQQQRTLGVPKSTSVCHSLSIGSLSSSTTKSSASSVSSTSSSTSSQGSSKKQLSTEDKKINLNALKNQDPFATNIIDTAFRVAVYKFVSKKNEWKKLDVEGSLFLFERMVEPLHSFVVMNTLALHLFLQPITADLEFQDRNPFLLYKSNEDIFGIWFIDKEDCDRIKSTITDLTQSARDRKLMREKSKHQNSMHPISARLTTPTNLLNSTSPIPDTNAYDKFVSQLDNAKSTGSTKTTEKSSCDIIQMLNKAQLKFNHSDHQSSGEQLSLNASSCLSSSPSASSTSIGYSTSDSKEMNPMIQKLLGQQQAVLPISVSTKTLDEIESGFLSVPSAVNSGNVAHDLLSEELKRKLNIKSSKVPLASSSAITTPSNPLIVTGWGGLNITDNASVKRPITVKDFEENLLNESSASTNSTPANLNIGNSNNNDKKAISDAKQAVFYVGGDNSGNSTYMRPSQLSFLNKKPEKKTDKKKVKKNFSSKYSSSGSSTSSAASTLSSCSSRTSASDSSTDTSSASSTSSSPRTLPLLLTPAAFETSSIASSAGSTSSSSKANIFNNFLNSQLLSSIDHQQKMAQKLKAKANGLPKTSTATSSIATSSCNNLQAHEPYVQQNTVLNKPQLQQCLIHLLTSDDKFLSSLHQAYLATNLAKQANQTKNSS